MIATLNVPQDWQKIRLKRIANLNPSKSEVSNLSDDIETTFLPMEAISESWEVDYSRTRPLEEVRNGYTYFRDGDILIAKITPCFENGKGALVNGCLNGFGFGTTEFHVIRSPNSETTRFLSYVVRSHRFKVEGAGMMTGTAGQKRLSDDYVKDFEIFLPSLSVQEEIARFLDCKTAAIDTLIAKKQRLIQLLEEKRTALLNQAVTKGLNPNAPMKDSGIPWIGEIPEHWEVPRIRFVAKLESGHTPSRYHPEYWVPEECVIPWFSLADVWQIRDHRCEYLKETSEKVSVVGLANSSARLLPAGTVVLSRTASVGFSGIMLVPMATTQDFVNWVCSPKVNPDFLLYVFRGMTQEFERLRMGSTHQTIYMPDVRSFSMPLPTVNEQTEIIEYIRQRTNRFNQMSDYVKCQIEKLQEYRRSLITAAVTGKLDIKEEDAA